MKKTFTQMMVESEEQYDYYLRATLNIHDDDAMEMIRLALLPYQLVELKRGGFTPIGQENEYFPERPNTPTYTLTVKLEFPLEPAIAIAKIATFLRMSDDMISFYAKGDKPDSRWEDDAEEDTGDYVAMGSTDPENTASVDGDRMSDADAEKEAGHKRIDAFMKELGDDRKAREEATQDREVYEAFVVPHNVAKEFTNTPQAVGYYLVERFASDHSRFRLWGAMSTPPDNYKLVMQNPYSIRNSTIVSESNLGDHQETEFQLEMGDNPRPTAQHSATKQTVVVTDTDSGRDYNIVVSAQDEASARSKAVRFVGKRFNIDVATLIARTE